MLFGRGFVEDIYEQEHYWERDPATGEVLVYDGPRPRALWPSQSHWRQNVVEI